MSPGKSAAAAVIFSISYMTGINYQCVTTTSNARVPVVPVAFAARL